MDPFKPVSTQTSMTPKKSSLSKPIQVALVLVGVFILFYLFIGVPYNHLVRRQQDSKAQWHNVDVVLQRRMDLIPNLVATVKGYAKHESHIFEAIAKAQSAWQTASGGVGGTTAKIQAAGQMDRAVGGFMILAQSYPKLQANKDFRDLMVELEGTENRISVERHRYNGDVRRYDTAVASFPDVFFARFFGFTPMHYYKSEAGAAQAPKVKF